MDFQKMKENIRQALDKRYEQVRQEFQGRPETSYQVVFDDERATINRIVDNDVRKAILYEILLELQGEFGASAGERLCDEFSQGVPKIVIPGHTWHSSATKSTETVTPRPVRKSDKGQVMPLVVLGGGCILGIVAAAVIGNASLRSGAWFGWLFRSIVLGGLGGAAAGFLALKGMVNKEKTGVRPISSSSDRSTIATSRPRVSLDEVLSKRKKDVEGQVLREIEKIEGQYTTFRSKLKERGDLS